MKKWNILTLRDICYLYYVQKFDVVNFDDQINDVMVKHHYLYGEDLTSSAIKRQVQYFRYIDNNNERMRDISRSYFVVWEEMLCLNLELPENRDNYKNEEIRRRTPSF